MSRVCSVSRCKLPPYEFASFERSNVQFLGKAGGSDKPSLTLHTARTLRVLHEWPYM